MSAAGNRRRVPVVALVLAAAVVTAGVSAGSAVAGGDIFIEVEDTHRIPDKGHGKVKMTASATPGTISYMFVGVRIKHPQTRDLKLSLRSPDGVRRVLSSRDTRGSNLGEAGEGCDGEITVFHSEFGSPLSGGSAPYAGAFTPVGDFSDYYGDPTEGDWTLTVRDLKEGHTGKIKCFELSFYLVH
jgi:subtilisin-like proprotein convertase family protein